MAQRVEIPDKEGFRIGEVAKLLDLEAYVLRYWETEFESLKPSKTRSGQRMYTQDDVRLLMDIQQLLHVELYTIAGARLQLERGYKDGQVGGDDVAAPVLAQEVDRGVDEALLAQVTQERDEALATQESLRLDLDVVEAQRQELERAHQETVAQHESLQKDVQELEQELESLSQRLAEREVALQEANQLHAQVDQGWDNFEASHHEQVATLQESLDALTKEHEALTRAYEGLTRQHTSLAEEHRVIHDTLEHQQRAQVTTQEALRRHLESLIDMATPVSC